MSERRTPRGRPPRVSRDVIARAAHEIGLAELTMKGVAARLEISVTTLYYHVQDRDELVRLAAEYAASQLHVPVDEGQHWAEWLAEWGEYAYRAFVSQPGLLEQFVNGTLAMDRMVPHIQTVLGVMEGQGFSTAEAMDAYMLVSGVAIGMAVSDVRGGGRSFEAEYGAAVAEALPARSPLREQMATVLVGVAVRRGDDPAAVLGALRPAVAVTAILHP